MTARRGRRERQVAAEREAAAASAPAPQPRLPFAPVPAVSADELEAIHLASLGILEEIGMDVLDAEARDILRDAGGRVEPGSQRVRLDRHVVEAAIGKAPRSFRLHARNPERTVEIGGSAVAFGSDASAPNVADRARGRRPGNRADFDDLLRLVQALPAIHVVAGYPVEPTDIHASVRHLDALSDMLTLTDKPIHAYSLGRQRILDGIEMARIARGIDREALEREPSLFTIINTSSPLRLDEPMCIGVVEMARANQVVCVTPFTLAGAMAPVTVAGAVTQQNAEALLGLVLAQAARPGSP
jgi:trimethylamine--corrinoid protein Co-methyltransferase